MATMRIHGYDVQLAAIKATLKRAGWNQTKIAGKIGVHQTAVSHYLIGRVPPTPAFTAFVESVISAGAVAAHVGAAPAQTGQPAAPAPAAQPAAPAPATVEAAAATKPDPYVPGHAPDTVEAFPIDAAQRVANMIRQAAADGHAAVSFGFRKLQSWGTAYAVLKNAGHDHKAALAGAFDLAVRAKVERGSEDYRLLTEAFFQEIGFQPAAPKADAKGWHPSAVVAGPFVKAGVPIWFYGPAGTGKTHAAVAIAKRLDRPYMRVQGSGDMTMEHLVGGQGAEAGSTVQHYGPLPLMMRAGGVLILDEPTIVDPAILMELQAVLEGEPLMLKGARPEVIMPAAGFTVVCCDNTLGLGEAIAYAGTRPMNEAFRDRFLFIEYGYMDAAQERAILAGNLARFEAAAFATTEGE